MMRASNPSPVIRGPDESIGELLTGVLHDARDLAVAHVDGLRLEVRDELTQAKRVAVIAAVALAVISIAALLAMIAIAAALATYTALPTWAAYAIVAGALVLLAGGFALWARARRPREVTAAPRRELEAAKEDAKWLAARTRASVTASSGAP